MNSSQNKGFWTIKHQVYNVRKSRLTLYDEEMGAWLEKQQRGKDYRQRIAAALHWQDLFFFLPDAVHIWQKNSGL